MSSRFAAAANAKSLSVPLSWLLCRSRTTSSLGFDSPGGSVPAARDRRVTASRAELKKESSSGPSSARRRRMYKRVRFSKVSHQQPEYKTAPLSNWAARVFWQAHLLMHGYASAALSKHSKHFLSMRRVQRHT